MHTLPQRIKMCTGKARKGIDDSHVHTHKSQKSDPGNIPSVPAVNMIDCDFGDEREGRST